MNKWMINRIGLINFWYYDDEEFEFSDGRLLLRGANGSGKSVTMQSFIPLLLDGNRTAKRLDPFGTNSRKIENYLLMDGDGRDENTGYLYMEFVKPETLSYLTVGIGLRARRGKPVEFWGFSITDGKRVGRDFFLYKNTGVKIPLTKRELKNRLLETGTGEFCERAADYKNMVNKYIFGFEDPAEYEQLIDLLVQLRSPKLSKDYKPTVLYEIMEESLKPLSDEDLRPMSEAIENMDNIEAAIASLKSAYESAKRLRAFYERYNQGVLYYKAEEYINALNEVCAIDARIKETENDIAENDSLKKAAEEKAEWLEQRRTQLEDKLRKFRETDIFKLNLRIMELEEEIANESAKLAEKENAKDERENAKRRSDVELRDESNMYEKCSEDMTLTLSEMAEHAREAAFGEHTYFEEELKNSEDHEFSGISAAVRRYKTELDDIIEGFRRTEIAEREYDRLNERYSNAEKDHENAVREKMKAETALDDEKSGYAETIYAWNKGNEYFVLSDEALQRTVQAVYASEDFDALATVKSAADEVYNNKRTECGTEIRLLKEKHSNLKKENEELSARIRDIEQQPELAPDLTEEQTLFRAELDRAGIPYVPLYRACDFEEGADERECALIEEALDSMGLLNALLIPKEYRDKLTPIPGAADKYIAAADGSYENSIKLPLFAENDTCIPKAEIESVLAALTDETSDIYIDKDGRYGISILNGFAGGSRKAGYIGAQSRKRRKEAILEQLRNEFETREAEKEELKRRIKELETRLDGMSKEYMSFPATDGLIAAMTVLKDADITVSNTENELKRLREETARAYSELNSLRAELDKLCAGHELPKSRKAYSDAAESIDEYRDSLGRLISIYKDACIHRNKLAALRERIEELQYSIDDLYADMRDIRHRLEKAKGEKANCEEVKRKSGYEDAEREMDEMQRELEAIPLALRKAEREIDRCDIGNMENEKKLNELRARSESAKSALDYCEKVFSEELALGYHDIDSEDTKKSTEKAALKALKQKPDGTLDELRGKLINKYYLENVELTDYSVAMEECFSEYEQRGNVPRSRTRLTARIRGAQTDFYTLTEHLENEIRENEELLTLKDKELFEDLLIDTVGKKMRAKIASSERWVADMNKKMTGMDTSSGLSFSLEWKSKPADSEDQMNTKELVELLKTDSRILNDEDIARISKHFRSKLRSARLRRDEADNTESMHVILKDILDYRKWFEFRLFYRMTGEPKRELTNNAFYRFSGGEKAMAMYVPLFASVYARYAKASPDAPKLISLDEAFAGIDDKNIADMFRIMEELGLSYIINSQVLWGTYSTVPSLAICELIRPNNSDTVSVIRYKWDGKNKELVL